MRTIVISGGRIDRTFADRFIKDNPADRIIGVDRGVEFLYDHKILPTDIVGDFDSIREDILDKFKGRNDVVIHQYPSEKDATDTEMAVHLALTYGSDEILILGGTGSRVDHLLGNIQLLSIPLEKGAECCLVDKNNRIRLTDKNITLRKEEAYGSFVSLIPLTTEVTGVTLEGFKYPLKDHLLTSRDSLGISNEMTSAEGKISLRDGVLIVIEAKD